MMYLCHSRNGFDYEMKSRIVQKKKKNANVDEITVIVRPTEINSYTFPATRYPLL